MDLVAFLLLPVGELVALVVALALAEAVGLVGLLVEELVGRMVVAH
jgi:hypothetical protein